MQKLLLLLMDDLDKNQTTVWSIISAVPLDQLGTFRLVTYLHHVVEGVMETALVLDVMVRWFFQIKALFCL